MTSGAISAALALSPLSTRWIISWWRMVSSYDLEAGLAIAQAATGWVPSVRSKGFVVAKWQWRKIISFDGQASLLSNLGLDAYSIWSLWSFFFPIYKMEIILILMTVLYKLNEMWHESMLAHGEHSIHISLSLYFFSLLSCNKHQKKKLSFFLIFLW